MTSNPEQTPRSPSPDDGDGSAGTMEQHFMTTYELHADGIYRFCLLKLSDVEMAHDLVQETFMRFWDTVRQGTVVANERAFLFTIAARLVIDRYRVKGRTTSLDKMQEDTGYEPADSTVHSASDTAEGNRALALIRKLPEAYRDVLLLRFVEGLEPKEIAEIIHDTANAVTVRIHRGVAKLREMQHNT